MHMQNANTKIPSNTQFCPVLRNAYSRVLGLFLGIVLRERTQKLFQSNKTTRLNQDIPRFISSLSSPQIPSSAEIQDGGCWRVTEFTIKMAGIPSAEVASQVPFYDLCSLLEKIAVTTGTEKKKKILVTFVSSWREAHEKLHGASKTVECVLSICGPVKFL